MPQQVSQPGVRQVDFADKWIIDLCRGSTEMGSNGTNILVAPRSLLDSFRSAVFSLLCCMDRARRLPLAWFAAGAEEKVPQTSRQSGCLVDNAGHGYRRQNGLK